MSLIRQHYYLGSIHRRWRSELRKARERVVVLSPYLTSPMAKSVLECAPRGICEIYTILSLENFATGASSINTLKTLQEHKYAVYELGNLHAKIIIVDGSFASIGSQNLTKKGSLNLEATVAVSDPSDVAAIAEGIEPWLANRRLITKQMLVDVEHKVAEVAERYKAARRELSRLDSSLREAARQRWWESWAQNARKSLHNCVENGRVSESIAREFIRSSIWWFHPKAETEVPAPKFALRVRGPDGDWRLRLGNTFLGI